jgi:AcrR family transcriptional regulator
MMTRPYRQRKRAEKQQETRQRIIDATVALHQELGLSKTTISAIAERAGVQRLTVYRHFPDERSLFLACSSQFAHDNPLPSPEIWNEIDDPVERLRSALAALYSYYERTEQMLEKVMRDIAENEIIQEVSAPLIQELLTIRDQLAIGWTDNPGRQQRVAAAIGHALQFPTWQSLERTQGLPRNEAVELMVNMVSTTAGRLR